MKLYKKNIEILLPRNQLSLFGHGNYFNTLVKLFNKNKMPNAILLYGPKGLGKATFAFHLVNYILSQTEKEKYSLENFKISSNNNSYKLVCNSTHPNFFLIENNMLSEEIKIEQVRNMLKFANKSTYSKNLKIILIDNAEHLNLYSSNALLKALEEPSRNSFFLIIHNSSSKILNTIKSRCIEFKFFLSTSVKREILENIINQYNKDFNIKHFDENLYFDTPGNLLKCLSILNDSNIDISKDSLSCILYLIDQYKNKKDSELLIFATLFIEKFYKELCLNNSRNLDSYFINKSKILNHINNMRIFNLDKKNLIILIKKILINESK